LEQRNPGKTSAKSVNTYVTPRQKQPNRRQDLNNTLPKTQKAHAVKLGPSKVFSVHEILIFFA